METIISLMTTLLVAGLVAASLIFGFALLMWFMLFALIVTAFMVLRQTWLRWRYGSNAQQAPDVHIIEVEYEELPRRDK